MAGPVAARITFLHTPRMRIVHPALRDGPRPLRGSSSGSLLLPPSLRSASLALHASPRAISPGSHSLPLSPWPPLGAAPVVLILGSTLAFGLHGFLHSDASNLLFIVATGTAIGLVMNLGPPLLPPRHAPPAHQPACRHAERGGRAGPLRGGGDVDADRRGRRSTGRRSVQGPSARPITRAGCVDPHVLPWCSWRCSR